MAERMGGITAEAGAVAAAMAAAHGLRGAAEGGPTAAAAALPDPAGWGFQRDAETGPWDAPPRLERFVVELDQRFLTELAHTAALFGELFEQSGRRRLLKARAGPGPARSGAGQRARSVGGAVSLVAAGCAARARLAASARRARLARAAALYGSRQKLPGSRRPGKRARLLRGERRLGAPACARGSGSDARACAAGGARCVWRLPARDSPGAGRGGIRGRGARRRAAAARRGCCRRVARGAARCARILLSLMSCWVRVAKHPSCSRCSGRCCGNSLVCAFTHLRACVWMYMQAAAAGCMAVSLPAAPPSCRRACQGCGCNAAAHNTHAATDYVGMLSSCAGLGEDWGTAELAAALYTFSTDVTRIKPLLPELSPADRRARAPARRAHCGSPSGAARPRGLRSHAGCLAFCARRADLLLARCGRRVAAGCGAAGHAQPYSRRDGAGVAVSRWSARAPTGGPSHVRCVWNLIPDPTLPCAGARRWWRAWCGTTWAPASARWSAACWTRWAPRRSACATARARARPAAARPAGTRCCRCRGAERVGREPWQPLGLGGGALSHLAGTSVGDALGAGPAGVFTSSPAGAAPQRARPSTGARAA